jgi:hypothetical protein
MIPIPLSDRLYDRRQLALASQRESLFRVLDGRSLISKTDRSIDVRHG